MPPVHTLDRDIAWDWDHPSLGSLVSICDDDGRCYCNLCFVLLSPAPQAQVFRLIFVVCRECACMESARCSGREAN